MWQKDKKTYPIEDNKKPILRGCNNKQCFCTGKCKEIVGYENRVVYTGDLDNKIYKHVEKDKVIHTEPIKEKFRL